MMYTVARFTWPPECQGKSAKTGAAMNVVRAGIYSGPSRRGNGFSCELCSDTSWRMHQQAILQFLADFNPFIESAHQDGASVTIDVALEPEDRESAGPIFVLRCEPAFLATLASAGVAIELSVY